MIRKLIAAAVLALVAAPLISLHQLSVTDAGATLSVLSEGGQAVYIVETRGLARLEPLLAAAIL